MTSKLKIGLAAAAAAALLAGGAALYAQEGGLRGPMAKFDSDGNGAITPRRGPGRRGEDVRRRRCRQGRPGHRARRCAPSTAGWAAIIAAAARRRP